MLACAPPFSQLLWPDFEPLCAAFLKGKAASRVLPRVTSIVKTVWYEMTSGKGPYCLRILLHGINYSPELTGIGKYSGEMAEWLAAHGHDVRVVTAPPYYPAWKVRKDYNAWGYRRGPGAGGVFPRSLLVAA